MGNFSLDFFTGGVPSELMVDMWERARSVSTPNILQYLTITSGELGILQFLENLVRLMNSFNSSFNLSFKWLIFQVLNEERQQVGSSTSIFKFIRRFNLAFTFLQIEFLQ